ncbi:MAG: phage virion morphogenesis protein [Proteobacteria bacterium]|nr:phage virion morphogenesis protein [Pseudomonadota bacterium]
MPDPHYIYDDREFQNMVRDMIAKLGNLEPAHEIAGEILHASILKNFEDGGRPNKWPDLAKSTKEQRAKQGTWPGQILVRTGVRGGLMGAVTYDAAPSQVVFLGNKPYSAIHHFGGMAGKGLKTKIPARPYMMIQDEDWQEIKTAIQQFIFEV